MPSLFRRRNVRSLSPFTRQKNKKVPTVGNHYHNEETDSGTTTSSSQSSNTGTLKLGENNNGKMRARRSRSASPFSFDPRNRKTKKIAAKDRIINEKTEFFTNHKNVRGSNTNNARVTTTSKTSREPSIPPFRSRLKKNESSVESTGKTGRSSKSKKQSFDRNNKRSESKKPNTPSTLTRNSKIRRMIGNKAKQQQSVSINAGSQAHSGSKDRTMKRHNKSILDKPPTVRRFNSNRSAKKERHQTFGNSMSFDSVIMYPPSKISIQHPQARDISSDGMSEKTKTAEVDAVDYPVHSIYQNVINELRHEIDLKKKFGFRTSEHIRFVEEKDYGPRKSERKNVSELERSRCFLHKPTSIEMRGAQANKAKNNKPSTGTPVNKAMLLQTTSSTTTRTSRLERYEDLVKNQYTPHRVDENNYFASSSATKTDQVQVYDPFNQGEEEYRPPLHVIEVPVRNAVESEHYFINTTLSDHQNKVEESETSISDKATTNQRISQPSISSRKSKGKQKRVIKKMSTIKSKSIRRLFKSQHNDDRDRPSKTKLQERRRNFTFMKSPSRRRISTATLEKTRARAKQLAEFAGSPDGKYNKTHNRSVEDTDTIAEQPPYLDDPYENAHVHPLNFAALDTESVVSGMSSIYDMDTFDEQSTFSSASNVSYMRNKPSKSRKNRLGSFNSTSQRRKPQHAIDMFESVYESERKDHFDDAFHPVTMKNRLSLQNNKPAQSDHGSMAMSFSGLNSGRVHRGATYSSSASVVSTSSSVSGAAARRLMRRTKNYPQSQQQQQLNSNNNTGVTSGGSVTASVTSEADSQYSGFDDSLERQRNHQERDLNQKRHSPSFSTGSRYHSAHSPNNWELQSSIECGLTFDAFGLDEHQIDDDVNAALAELAQTNPDISMFMSAEPNNDSQSTATVELSTTQFSTPSNQQSPLRRKENYSRYTEREGSVASITSKSYDSTNKLGRTPIAVGNQNIKSSSIKPNTTMNEGYDVGRRNTQHLRNVKEQMKSKLDTNEKCPELPSHRKRVLALDLPDIGSNDSEDSQSANIRSDHHSQRPYSDHLSENPSDEFGESLSPQEDFNESTVLSEDAASSQEEPTEFIPRQTALKQHDNNSKSQKRAQSWASERNTPIIISPLLVPSKSRSKPNTTSSQKRAKAWAGACPKSPDVMSRAPHLKAEREVRGKKSSVQFRPSDAREIEPPIREYTAPRLDTTPSEQTIVCQNYADLSTSVTSEDHEVELISEASPHAKKMQIKLGRRLPMPTEKVVLRRTESPVFQPDYDMFKTSAPKVILRKVQPKPSNAPKESPNFLSNIKLKKVTVPAPRVEHDKMHSTELEGENCKLDELENDIRDPVPRHQGYAEIFNDNTPPDNFVQIATTIRTPKPIKVHDEESTDGKAHPAPISTKLSSIYSSFHSNKNSSSSAFLKTDDEHSAENLIRQSMPVSIPAPNEADIIVLDAHEIEPTPKSLTPKMRNDLSAMNPVAALFAARASINQSKPNGINDPEGKDQVLSTVPAIPASLNSNVSSAKAIEKVSSQDEEEKPSINNVAALFAQRSATMEPSPPANNVAALFAQRSAMMKPSPSTPDNLGIDNEQILEAFSRRSSSTSGKVEISNVALPSVNDYNAKESSENVALKGDPKFAKYFKMLKMGLPMGAVKNAMTRDGLDPDIMDGNHDKPANINKGVPLKEDPKFAKYFKMLKMGLPMGAIKNAMIRDGEDPNVMDGDHNAAAKMHGTDLELSKPEPLPKDKYRRTRVHWDTLRQVKSTSVWALVNQDPDLEDIEIDESEFAELFQAEAGQVLAVDSNANKKSNAVKVIDPKRANNGGIVLARLKITYEEMAVAIDTINDKVMTIEQVQGILEYIPTKDEKQSLRKYMTASDKDSADAFDELCECEKFMVAMMTVKHSREKVRALLFKLQFRQCVSDLESDVTLVEKACDELKESVSLRKLLGIVLNIGNRLNTAGPTRKGKAGAFTIKSLLKLNQAKAFDKKTTFLHYIVLVVLRHNDVLTNFKDDLPSVLKADKIYWDQIETDLEEVENQLENVRKIALHEVFGKKLSRKRGKGEDDNMSQDSMSLEEEVEALRSTRIGIFTLQAIKIVSALRGSVETTRSKFLKVLEYFGEDDNKKMNPHELFQIICVFTKDFNAAKEDVLSLEKEKLKQHNKNQSTPVKARSPSVAGRDSERGKTSSEQNNSASTTRKLLRASSMQPHLNTVIMARSMKQTPSNTQDTVSQITSESVEDSQINTAYRAEESEIASWSKIDGKSTDTTDVSRFSDGNIFDDTDATTNPETMNSDDSREEAYDENLVPPYSINDRNHSQSDEEASPLQVVERNMEASIEEKDSSTVRRKHSNSHSNQQTMRQKARSMRQQRMRNVRRGHPDGSPSLNRQRPTPERSGRNIYTPSPEGKGVMPSPSNEQISSRRDRITRRQRNEGF